jgi:hypothetical protein
VAGDGAGQGVEQDDEAPPAGVDDARVGEVGQLGGRALQRDVGRPDGVGHDLAQVRAERSVSRRPGHAQDRALDRRQDGVPGERGAAVEPGGDGRPVNQRVRCVGQAAQDLRHHDPGVAYCSAGRADRQRRESDRGIGGLGGRECGVGRAQRGDQVPAGVRVRHGVDVEGVDLGAVGHEQLDGDGAPAAHGRRVQCVEH